MNLAGAGNGLDVEGEEEENQGSFEQPRLWSQLDVGAMSVL